MRLRNYVGGRAYIGKALPDGIAEKVYIRGKRIGHLIIMSPLELWDGLIGRQNRKFARRTVSWAIAARQSKIDEKVSDRALRAREMPDFPFPIPSMSWFSWMIRYGIHGRGIHHNIGPKAVPVLSFVTLFVRHTVFTYL